MVGLTQTLRLEVGHDADSRDRSRAVAVWLFLVAALVLAMVVVGGATRLTGSGLSITQWKPILGALPPLSEAAWTDAFNKYRASSQYRLINQGLSLESFKPLFWWEWSHRLLGRALGAVFAFPLVAFLLLRTLPRRLGGRCAVLLALGGLQGLVGWWMVESGLEGRAAVAPERLAVHLGLALVLFSTLIWTGLEAWAGPTRAVRRGAWPGMTRVFVVGVYLQCLLGALVAGNHAGLIDGDWPLMAGRIFPEGYWQNGIWSTFAHSLAAVQFNHRMLAYLLLVFVVVMAWKARRDETTRGDLRGLIFIALALISIQAGLGVMALRMYVPLAVALLHQANAALLLAAAVILAWRGQRV